MSTVTFNTMSYDLDLFVPVPNIDPVLILQEAAFVREKPQTELNIELVGLLIEDNPQFEERITVDSLELIDPNDGIQAYFHSHTARISIPYWYEDARRVRLAFVAVQRYLQHILKITNYTVYDAQLGRIVHIERDLDAMMARYTQTLREMQSFT